jgi:hypothetical protein
MAVFAGAGAAGVLPMDGVRSPAIATGEAG